MKGTLLFSLLVSSLVHAKTNILLTATPSPVAPLPDQEDTSKNDTDLEVEHTEEAEMPTVKLLASTRSASAKPKHLPKEGPEEGHPEEENHEEHHDEEMVCEEEILPEEEEKKTKKDDDDSQE